MTDKRFPELPHKDLQIRRALISVSDKNGIGSLARSLHEAGIEIISTGGTAEVIENGDIPVTDIKEITRFPECLDGRVKTLHPGVHAGILARTSYQPDLDELRDLDIAPIELVVANLYPFRETVARNDVSLSEATENIDIGGPAMIRAAAKNFAHVCVLTKPEQYEDFITELNEKGEISFELRRQLARSAFNHTAEYDHLIANYFNHLDDVALPEQLNISLPKARNLRYGENPHQKAAVYGAPSQFINCFHGKELSYNNYMDIDAALNLLKDFKDDQPTCAIFKHTIPCGVSTADSLFEAYNNAFASDTISPFGGIVAVNREMDLDTAEALDKIFTEIVIAPSYSDEALELLKQKKKRRLIEINSVEDATPTVTYRSISGGVLYQDYDSLYTDYNSFEVVTNRSPDEREKKDLLFAWKVVKHVKSNAIIYAGDQRTLGIGAGQASRVDASEIAVRKAEKENNSLDGSVIASDAFFPFADGVEAAAKAGARAVIQPGGSIRDEEVIERADEYDMTMLFTGNRHFRH